MITKKDILENIKELQKTLENIEIKQVPNQVTKTFWVDKNKTTVVEMIDDKLMFKKIRK